MRDSKVTTGKGARFERDWTKGGIARNLLSLAWPMIISDAINTIGPVIDMIWVAKLGAAAVAGVGIAGLLRLVIQFGVRGLNSGMRAMVARFVGAGDNEGAIHVAQQNLVVLTVYAVVMVAVGIVFAVPMLKLFGVAADVVTHGAAYLRVAFVASGVVAFHQMTEIIMQASGDSVTPMQISIITRIVHAAICPFLVLGWWIFPRLGTSGAAVANVISLGLAMALGLWVVFTGRSRLRLTLKRFRFDFDVIWRIVKIGIPSGIMSAQGSLANMVLISFIVPFGTVAVAAHTLVGNIMGYATVPSFGLARASGALAGQNLGAQQPKRASQSAWVATVFGEIIIIVFSIVVLLWPSSVIRLFSTDPEVIKTTSIFMRIAVASILASVINYVLEESLSGSGDTLPPMFISLLDLWVITLPLAYLLPHITNLGVYGVRWAIVAGEVVIAIVFVIYFQTGRWKRKKV